MTSEVPKGNATQKASQQDGDSLLVPVFAKLPPQNIVDLKFILEGYDDVGILRTINREKGEIVILAVQDTAETARAILESIKEELGVRIIDPPESVNEDWLLREYYADTEAVAEELDQASSRDL